ncbi:MAG: hypothetical protein ACOX78_04355 [Lachnospiraceae bacterium]|jgi:hypothetical protein
MHLKKDIDLTAFVNTAKKCRGDVTFRTKEGDKLNLKSTLSQYVFVSLVGHSDILSESEVICDNQDDIAILAAFLDE